MVNNFHVLILVRFSVRLTWLAAHQPPPPPPSPRPNAKSAFYVFTEQHGGLEGAGSQDEVVIYCTAMVFLLRNNTFWSDM